MKAWTVTMQRQELIYCIYVTQKEPAELKQLTGRRQDMDNVSGAWGTQPEQWRRLWQQEAEKCQVTSAILSLSQFPCVPKRQGSEQGILDLLLLFSSDLWRGIQVLSIRISYWMQLGEKQRSVNKSFRPFPQKKLASRISTIFLSGQLKDKIRKEQSNPQEPLEGKIYLYLSQHLTYEERKRRLPKCIQTFSKLFWSPQSTLELW